MGTTRLTCTCHKHFAPICYKQQANCSRQGACEVEYEAYRTLGLQIFSRMGFCDTALLLPTTRSVSIVISFRISSKS